MMPIVFSPTLEYLKNGKSWTLCKLRGLERVGRLKRMMLGASIQAWTTEGPMTFDISEFVMPIVWSTHDEVLNSSENHKISFCKAMCENAIRSHDEELFHRIGGGSAITSNSYRYVMSEPEQAMNSPLWRCNIFTAVAFIPDYITLL